MSSTKTYDLILTFKNYKAVKSKNSDSYHNEKRPHTCSFEDFDFILLAVCREMNNGADEAPTLLYYIYFFFFVFFSELLFVLGALALHLFTS